VYSPSTNWSQAGPIIEREQISLKVFPDGWTAWCGDPMDGSNPLEAAMRCYVASKLGDEVDIPEELLS